MRLTKLIAASAALSLTATPVLAANPAASLSIAHSVRTSSHGDGASDLAGGGGFFVAIIAAVVVIVGIIVVANNDDKPKSP